MTIVFNGLPICTDPTDQNLPCFMGKLVWEEVMITIMGVIMSIMTTPRGTEEVAAVVIQEQVVEPALLAK
jgi:hypothetical protein